MFPQLYFATLLIVSIELFFIGLVIGFFQDKVKFHDIIKLVVSSIIVFVLLYLGSMVGTYAIKWLGNTSSWYGATVLLFLGLKMFYDKIKLSKLKELINPLETKGLIVLTALMGINVFFIGLASSLMATKLGFIYASLPVLLGIAILGYFLGFNIKKLLSRRFEFLSGILYIIIAIIIASNI